MTPRHDRISRGLLTSPGYHSISTGLPTSSRHCRTVPCLRYGGGLLLLVMTLTVSGCGARDVKFSEYSFEDNGAVASSVGDAAGPAGGSTSSKSAPSSDATSSELVPKDSKLLSAEIERKIIYTAYIDVVVKELEAAMTEVKQLVQAHKGYIAKSEVRGRVGQRRTADYVLRVPVDNFTVLREGLFQLGLVERNALESQDVTEEYVDIQARLRVLQQEEETLNKLLRDSVTRDDLLKTRDHLLQVRCQIEKAQGRLNLLSRLTSLATIHLKLREEQNYQPHQSSAAPTLGERMSITFRSSWHNFTRFLASCTLTAVALVPWLPVLVPAGLLLTWLWKRRYRCRSVPVVSPPQTPTANESPLKEQTSSG